MASFYFLVKYDEAFTSCLNLNSQLENSFVSMFVKGCEVKMGEANEIIHKTEKIKINQIDLIDKSSNSL